MINKIYMFNALDGANDKVLLGDGGGVYVGDTSRRGESFWTQYSHGPCQILDRGVVIGSSDFEGRGSG